MQAVIKKSFCRAGEHELAGPACFAHAGKTAGGDRGLSRNCPVCGLPGIRQRVGQSELKTREKLPEIELRVARLADALEARSN